MGIVSRGLYPLLLAATAGYLAFELNQPAESLGRHYGMYLGALVVALATIEALHPMKPEWKMQWSTLLGRDLPYIALNAAVLGAANYAAGWLLLHAGWPRGHALAQLPLLPSVLVAVALPDLLWYWLHRASHEGRGAVGRWLWRVHVPHHMPQQLYVMMHAVGHPLNTVAVRLILSAPLFALGISPEAVFVAAVIVALQGVVSHFNVDMRAGWMNYVLVGNELHRYHHSADVAEAKNFAAVVPLWDIVFGTFVYRPGVAPRRLGLADPAGYPPERDIVDVLSLPFRTERSSRLLTR
jgi:sterol desaturase/sphingolipid hydroxylase (fatty acid hydroxylase superfamily)